MKDVHSWDVTEVVLTEPKSESEFMIKFRIISISLSFYKYNVYELIFFRTTS